MKKIEPFDLLMVHKHLEAGRRNFKNGLPYPVHSHFPALRRGAKAPSNFVTIINHNSSDVLIISDVVVQLSSQKRYATLKQVWSTNTCVLLTFFQLNSSISALKKNALLTDQPTERRINQRTDRPSYSYRDARTHKKIMTSWKI